MDELKDLAQELHDFATERNWLQHHTPKNLAMALSAEVGELIAEFQWLTEAESYVAPGSEAFARIEDELADVLIYLVRLTDVLGSDLMTAARTKLERNRARFPLPG